MNKRILKAVATLIPALWLVFLSGCLKTHDGFIDFTQTTDFVILTGAGLGNFKASNLAINTSSPDTLRKTITVDLASKDNSNGAITVTIGVDNAVIPPYNSANGKNFQPFPANAFKLISNQVTIPAGQHYGTTTVEIYQNKLDGSLDYLLPISITDGGGKNLSSNQNTIYYNVIGNPYAGNYNYEGYFYHPSSPRALPNPNGPSPKSLVAISSTIVQVDLGDLGGAGYIAYLTVDPTTHHVKVFDPPGWYNSTDDFLTQFDSGLPTSNPGYTAAWPRSAECNNTYDPATKTFYLRYGYLGGTGWRVTEEILVKQ
jgi:uncharacterized protein DUF1735